MGRIRRPSAAGTFYAGDPEGLRQQLHHVFSSDLGPGEVPQPENDLKKVVGIVVPHAGYSYSGQVASHSYHFLGRCGRPKTVIIIGPNHTGLGAEVSITTEGFWETPLGKVPIDSKIAKLILQESTYISESEEAFSGEHSLEVQLPFLQFLYHEFKFVPLLFRNQTMKVSTKIGKNLAKIIEDNEGIALIASSDFTHYRSQEAALKNDNRVIEKILRLNIDEFYETIAQYSISICGYGPIAALMEVAKRLDLSDVNLLKYATSGDVTGRKDEVVGYAGISFISEEP